MEVSLTEDLDLLRIWLNRHPEYSGRVDAVCIEGALKYACSACRKCYAVGDLRKSGTADGVDGVTISPNIGSYVRHLKTCKKDSDADEALQGMESSTDAMESDVDVFHTVNDAPTVRPAAVSERVIDVISRYTDDGIAYCFVQGSLRIKCFNCPDFLLDPSRVSSWEKNIKQHITTESGATRENHGSRRDRNRGLTRLDTGGFVTVTAYLSLRDFKNPAMAAMCLGCQVDPGSAEEEVLLNLPLRPTLQFVPVLRYKPIIVEAKEGTNAETLIRGHAFRSTECAEVSPYDRPFPNHTCDFCANIFNLEQFQRELDKREEGVNKHRAHEDDHRDFLVERLVGSNEEVRLLRKKNIRAAIARARPKPTLDETLKVRTCIYLCFHLFFR